MAVFEVYLFGLFILESSAKTEPLTTCELLYATPFFPIVTIL
jgi:hypothetical protein